MLKTGELMVPLYNLEIESDIDLPLGITEGAELQLSPLVEEEREYIFRGLHSDYAVLGIKYKLHGTYQYEYPPSGLRPASDRLVREAEKFIWALRLINSGDIGAQLFYDRFEARGSRDNAPLTLLGPPDATQTRPHSVNEYRFKKEELEKGKELFIIFGEKFEHLRALTTALRRFNISYNRQSAEDRIIDLIIALKSSLLRGISTELGYRLSYRGAVLLVNLENPLYVRDFLKASYDIRSKIVHDGKGLSEIKNDKKISRALSRLNIDIRDSPSACEEIVRKTLREYILRINSGKSIDEIQDDLDDFPLVTLKRNFSR